jgi:hypothetical protein
MGRLCTGETRIKGAQHTQHARLKSMSCCVSYVRAASLQAARICAALQLLVLLLSAEPQACWPGRGLHGPVVNDPIPNPSSARHWFHLPVYS